MGADQFAESPAAEPDRLLRRFFPELELGLGGAEIEGLVVRQLFNFEWQAGESAPDRGQVHDPGVVLPEVLPVNQPVKDLLQMGEVRQADDQGAARRHQVRMFPHHRFEILEVLDEPEGADQVKLPWGLPGEKVGLE